MLPIAGGKRDHRHSIAFESFPQNSVAFFLNPSDGCRDGNHRQRRNQND
jgi:hypothetical protein